MSDIDITVSLPEELVARARTEGLLDDKRIALLLEAALERIDRWRTLDKQLEPLRDTFHAQYADMNEDEIMDMINDVVHEVRDEINQNQNVSGQSEA
jgi:hypothetical protein